MAVMRPSARRTSSPARPSTSTSWTRTLIRVPSAPARRLPAGDAPVDDARHRVDDRAGAHAVELEAVSVGGAVGQHGDEHEGGARRVDLGPDAPVVAQVGDDLRQRLAQPRQRARAQPPAAEVALLGGEVDDSEDGAVPLVVVEEALHDATSRLDALVSP